jgi:hypothetical protein
MRNFRARSIVPAAMAFPPDSSPAKHRALLRTAIHCVLAHTTGLALSACQPGNREAKRLRGACDAGDAAACTKLAVKLRKEVRPPRRDARRGVDRHMHRRHRRRMRQPGAMLQTAPAFVATRPAPPGFSADAKRIRWTVARARRALQTGWRAAGFCASGVALQQACDGKQISGCAHLASLYAAGEGVLGFPLQRPCSRGMRRKIALGCVGLGRLHAAGTGVAQSDRRRRPLQGSVRRERALELFLFGRSA